MLSTVVSLEEHVATVKFPQDATQTPEILSHPRNPRKILPCEAPKSPFDSVQLVNITPIPLWFMDVYGIYAYSYWGESKPTYNIL